MSKKIRLGPIGASGIAEAHINGILVHPDKFILEASKNANGWQSTATA